MQPLPSPAALADGSAAAAPVVARRAPRSVSAPGTIPLVWLIWPTVTLSVATLWMMAGAGLALDVGLPLGATLVAGAAAAGAILYRLRAPASDAERMVRDATAHVALFVLICLAGALASYPIAAASTGFADAPLARIDRALGFDWVALYRFVADRPALQPFERAAYHSIFVTPAILLGYFAYKGWSDRARHFILAFWLAAVLTLAAFALMPARGPLASLWHGPLPYVPINGLSDARVIEALRLHELRRIDLGDLCGLVGAPSFHTASAVLFAVAAWPSARLRWPVAMVNLAMMAATPVEGTHYFADMLLGALVAAAALGVTAQVGRRARLVDPARG